MLEPSRDLASLEAFIAADSALCALREELAAALAGDEDPGHDAAHALRVALWTLRLAPDESPRAAIAAALLHDIVNLPKDHPDRHLASERSAERARELLPRLDFDAAATERVAAAIRDHSFSRGATPESPLGDALQDADRLEALGALGLCRTLSTGARMGARYFHGGDPWAEQRELDDRRYSVDHFFTKLLGLPATMRTTRGREEAERRAAFLESFLGQLAGELGISAPGASSPEASSPGASSLGASSPEASSPEASSPEASSLGASSPAPGELDTTKGRG